MCVAQIRGTDSLQLEGRGGEWGGGGRGGAARARVHASARLPPFGYLN